LVGTVLFVGLAIARFGRTMAPLVVAVIIAYVLNLPVSWIARRTRIPRKLIAVVTYITFFTILALIPAALTPILIQQSRRIDVDLQTIDKQIAGFITQPLVIFGLSFDLRDVATQITGALTDMVSPFATGAINVLFGIAEGVIWIIIIFVVGLYLLLDADKIGNSLDSLAGPDYRHEVTMLRREIASIWNSFFVGQLILCTVIGITIGSATAILGIRSAFILGIVAAVAELVPNVGHTVSAIVGVTVAFIEGSYLPVSNLTFAVIVAAVYIAIIQVDTNFFIPRIIGQRMHLSPAVVIVGLVAGASVGGVLGLLLAAPTLASFRILGLYIHRRLLDMEPYVLTQKKKKAQPTKADQKTETPQPPAPSLHETP